MPHRLDDELGLRHFTREIGGVEFKLFTSGDYDKVFERLLNEAPNPHRALDEKPPYWADLWPSSVAMAEYLLEVERPGPQTEVLEIGCGMGLAGLAAAKCGARVTLTDYLPEALEVAEYLWSLNEEKPADVRLLDWRKPNPDLAADLVLAADVAYEERQFSELDEAFPVLTKTGGQVLLSEPSRPYVNDWWNRLLLQGAEPEGETRIELDEVLTRVRLLRLDPHR
jgi:predicted nicotinamide N-methyase